MDIYAAVSPADEAKFKTLYRGSLIPLHACLVGLVWIFHDYLITLEDEIRYIWPQKRSFGKFMYLWIRYYSLVLLVFDVAQIHSFSIPGVTSDTVCVVMDSMIRVVGALSLWSIEIIMMLRVYALYKCSRTVALVMAALFLASVGGFMGILIHNGMKRHSVIADSIHYPLPGCPSVHSGIEWAQWVPATCFEGVLFGFALFKTVRSAGGRVKTGRKISLYQLILRDNLAYFFAISVLLIFNNLMVVGITKIPWFSYSPFHAAMGILTTRMLLNLRKATVTEIGPTEMRYMTNSLDPTDVKKKRRPETSASIGTFRAQDGRAPSMSFGTTTNGSSLGSTTFGSIPHPYAITEKPILENDGFDSPPSSASSPKDLSSKPRFTLPSKDVPIDRNKVHASHSGAYTFTHSPLK
ncbi:hypothetical protein DL96DRAFT_1470099 [Flagelloscypha sp. PMI_526]|nr:hypothetical protein DL96DRAFT_1470099 [Flagelloscypha sp. PMI_526]